MLQIGRFCLAPKSIYSFLVHFNFIHYIQNENEIHTILQPI